MKWTEEKINFLKEKYPFISNKEIALEVGTTEDAVARKASFLKLFKSSSWTKNETNFLIENYKNKSYSQLGIIINRSTSAIKGKIKSLGLVKPIQWTVEEENLLRYHWPISKPEIIREIFPNRNYSAVMARASILKIKREIDIRRKTDLSFLNEITSDSCYWWGFIMADGYIGKRGQFTVVQKGNYTSKIHLEKLALKLNADVKETQTSYNFENTGTTIQYSIWISDIKFATKWREKLSIITTKTYCPPDLSIFLTKENLIYFLIGFIDGDGCIFLNRKWFQIKIEIHVNWLETLQNISDNLKEFYNILSYTNISSRGFAQLHISRRDSIRILKEYSKQVDAMERKWSKLDGY